MCEAGIIELKMDNPSADDPINYYLLSGSDLSTIDSGFLSNLNFDNYIESGISIIKFNWFMFECDWQIELDIPLKRTSKTVGSYIFFYYS